MATNHKISCEAVVQLCRGAVMQGCSGAVISGDSYLCSGAGGWMVLAPHEGSREIEGGGGARPPSMATNHKISDTQSKPTSRLSQKAKQRETAHTHYCSASCIHASQSQRILKYTKR